MAEKKLIINNRELVYKGIFKADQLFSVINQALEKRGYAKNEKRAEELVQEEGKRFYLELRPHKVKSTYASLMIKIKITLDNLTEFVEEGKKYEQGNVKVVFDSWLITDYEARWGMKPWVYFLKGFINKYVYKFPIEKGLPEELGEDTAYIYAQVKKYLVSHQKEAEKIVSEQEIIKQINKEMREELKKGKG